MIHLSVKMLPESGSDELTHKFADLEVSVKVDCNYHLKDNYSFMIYSENYSLMAGATTWEKPEMDSAKHTGRTFSMTMHGREVWMPGKYFFLMSSEEKGGGVDRIDLELDDQGNFSMGRPYRCKRLSDEVTLSHRLFYRPFFWRSLTSLPGAAQFRRWILDRAKWNQISRVKDEEDEDTRLRFCNNLLVTMDTPSMSLLPVKLLISLSDIQGSCREGDCATFFDPTNYSPYHVLDDFFDEKHCPDSFVEPKDFVFIFHNLGASNDGLNKALSRLHKVWPSDHHNAVFCGTQSEIDTLLELNPTLGAHFPEMNRVSEEPYTLEEVLHGFFKVVEEINLKLSPMAVDKICRLLIEASRQGNLWRWNKEGARHFLKTELIPKFSLRSVKAISQGELSMENASVTPEDIDDEAFIGKTASLGGLFDELGAMIGLGDIKRSIATLSNRRNFFTRRRQLGLNTSDEGTYHAIFTGNPGTGKTTVAKMMGRIYHSLGLLSNGEVICVDRKTIVGRYIGQTEENMKQILAQAHGNVLLVDEAYNLYIKDDEKDFGRHAVDCLMTVLSSKSPDMLIIFAGYKQEMDDLMAINPGLAGRFPYKFHFPDYDAGQLMAIAVSILEKDQYVLTDEARSLLLKAIRDTLKSTSTFQSGQILIALCRRDISS